MTKSTAPALVLTVMVATTALGPLDQEAMAQVSGETPVPSLTTIRLETIRSRDEDLLRDLAAALSERHPDLLAGTEILFTRVESFGTVFYRMDIQGIEGEAAARDLCRILEMEQCLVARPGASILASPEAFSVAPDGLVAMTAPVSGSVDAVPLPTQGEGWSPVEALEDRLSSLPLDRPDPESLKNPEPLPWEQAVASAEKEALSPPDSDSGMWEGVASSFDEPAASTQPAPDDGASLDLDGAIEHARLGGASPPRLALAEDTDGPMPAAPAAAPVVSVSVTGADGAPVPLAAPEADAAALEALAAQVREAPEVEITVAVAGPDTIRPRPRPTTGVFAQDAAAPAAEEAPGPSDVVVAVAGPDTIRPRPRPTTGVFARAETTPSEPTSVAQASEDALPKPVWAAGPRPTLASPNVGQAERKLPQVVAPVQDSALAQMAPLRAVPSPRPTQVAQTIDGLTRTQALALAVEEARAARVAERLAKGGAPEPAPSSATAPVVAVREEDAVARPSDAAPPTETSAVVVAVAGPDTIRPRPRPTTGVFAELAARDPAPAVEADAVQESREDVPAQGRVGEFARFGAAIPPTPGLRPARDAASADIAASSIPDRPQSGKAGTAETRVADTADAGMPTVALPGTAPVAPLRAPEPVRLAWAFPSEPSRLGGAVHALGVPSFAGRGDAVAPAQTFALAQGAASLSVDRAPVGTSLRFHADVALADSSAALLAFRVPRSNAFARWALGTVSFPIEGGALALGGVLPEPVRVAAATVGAAPRAVPSDRVLAVAEVNRRAVARSADAPSVVAQVPMRGEALASPEPGLAQEPVVEVAQAGLPVPVLRSALEPSLPDAVFPTFASLGEAGRALQAGAAPVAPVAVTAVGARSDVPPVGIEPVAVDTASIGITPTVSARAVVALEENETVSASRLAALILVGTSPLASPSQAQSPLRLAGVEIPAVAVAGVEVGVPPAVAAAPALESVAGVEVAVATADTPRPRMRPTTGVFASLAAAQDTEQDPVKLAALFPTLRPQVGAPTDAAQVALAPSQEVYAVETIGARVRPDAVPVRVDDRPIHAFLDVWGVAMPLTEVEWTRAQPRRWGEVEAPVEVVEAVFAPTARLIAGETEPTPSSFQVLNQGDEAPRTLEEFTGVLTAPDAVFDVPGVVDFEALAEERRVSEAERALLAATPTGDATVAPEGGPVVPSLRPTADSIAAASQMVEGDALPATIRATVGTDTIALETDTRRVVAPRRPAPISRFAVVLGDTYAMPFDLTGSGVPALQRMPMLRPAIVDGAEAPIAATLVAGAATEAPASESIADPADMARFFPAPGSVEAAPVVPDVFDEASAAPAAEGAAPADDAALAMMDRLRGGLDETLSTLEIPVETPPEEVVVAGQTAESSAPAELGSESLAPAAAPVAPGPSRPSLELPPLSVEGRPSATAPLVETAEAAIDPSLPVTEAPSATAEAAPRVTAFEGPSPVPFAQDSAAVGVAGVPGSTGASSPGQVAAAPNEALMIRLTYANSEEAVKTIVASLRDSFPPSLLKRGRFFGKSAPASPGLYIVGIEANTPEDLAGLVAYMHNNGIPYVLSGQSAAPILSQQP